jgi:hypothetical protein
MSPEIHGIFWGKNGYTWKKMGRQWNRPDSDGDDRQQVEKNGAHMFRFCFHHEETA